MMPDLQERGHLLVPGVWWSALTRRYRSRPPATGNYGISLVSTVQPVTIVDRLLDRPRLRQVATASIVADGVSYLFAVPPGKLWEVFGFRVSLSPSTPLGAFSAAIGIEDAQPTPLSTDLQVATVVTTVLPFVVFGQPLRIAPGWQPYVRVTSWTVAGILDFTMIALESDVSDERTPLTI